MVAANLDITDDSDPLQIATQAPDIKTIKINSESLTRKLKDCGGIESKRGDFSLKSTDTDRNKRVHIGKVFGPNGNQPLKAEAELAVNSNNSALKYKKTGDKRKNIDVVFKIAKGLADFVAGDGSTKIDGFITYQITLTITTGGADIDVASARITVQGLTDANQDVVYGHRFEAPEVEGRNGEDLDVKVEIIEVGVRERTTFELVGYGYKLLDAS